MAKKRAGSYSQVEIIKLMEAAGWEARRGTNHVVLNKPGSKAITLTDPPHKNGISEIQRELGLHISKLLTREKGKTLTRKEIIRRISLAQQMWGAGLASKFVVATAGLEPFFPRGITTDDMRTKQPHEIANMVEKQRMEGKGVKIVHPAQRVEQEPPKPTADQEAVLDLLGEVSGRLEMVTRTDRLSLLGSYLDKIQLTLIDAKAMKVHFEKGLEFCNKIIERLETER